MKYVIIVLCLCIAGTLSAWDQENWIYIKNVKEPLKPYYISKYEVTTIDAVVLLNWANKNNYITVDNGYIYYRHPQKQLINYNGAMDGYECKIEYDGHFFVDKKFEKYPVNYITYYGALALCNFKSEKDGLPPVYKMTPEGVELNKSMQGYRLPTVGEWEWAASSFGANSEFVWGTGKPNGNIAGEEMHEYSTMWKVWEGYRDPYIFTAPVATFAPNGIGLFDMEGNLSEWVWPGLGKGGSWMTHKPLSLIGRTQQNREHDFGYTDMTLRMVVDY